MTNGPDPEEEARSVSPGPPVPPLPWRRVPHAGRRRSAGAGLDRERIVDAGLQIVDAEGVEALSLRRLAADLGVTPMAMYWHVRDKTELLELIGERVLETIEVPPAAGDWRRQLRDVHLAMLPPMLEHPNAVELMIGRARFGPAGIALFERILAVLLGAGLSAEAAFDAYQSLYLFQLGFTATSSRSPEFIEGQRQGAGYLRALDPERFPAIAKVGPVIGARPPAEAYGVGLEVVIEGIAARLAPSRNALAR